MSKFDSLSTTIRDSAAKLNALCDDAARAVQATEKYLSDECHVGVYAAVHISADQNGVEKLLAFFRLNGKYRVGIEIQDPQDTSEYHEFKAWAECSREDKLFSFTKLPELLVEVEKKLKEHIKMAEDNTTETLKKLSELKWTTNF